MKDTLLLSRSGQLTPLPRAIWESHLAHAPAHAETRLSFMTPAHHRLRYFVVTELPRLGTPLPPEYLARQLRLPLPEVIQLLDDLERHLFFLVRNEQGAVAWAYPVTAEPTPHRLTFSSGERIYAAGAEDAIATPFVQGQLRRQAVEVDIKTVCAHCNRPLHIRLDSAMRYQVASEGAEPLLFEPSIDWASFTEPNIIHAYGHNSRFFWSEEHAREFWRQRNHPDGHLLTLEQSCYATPIGQGALFGLYRPNWAQYLEPRSPILP